jgi:hypothetical protein
MLIEEGNKCDWSVANLRRYFRDSIEFDLRLRIQDVEFLKCSKALGLIP